MIQHICRKLANLLPASSDVSIPLHAIVQTALASVFMVTLRFSSLLVGALLAVAAVRSEPLQSEALLMLTATAWSDRSAVSYLRVRRHTPGM